jgi:hypothetical protein
MIFDGALRTLYESNSAPFFASGFVISLKDEHPDKNSNTEIAHKYFIEFL